MPEETLSGLHPDIVKNAKRTATPPILAVGPDLDKRTPLNCIIVFPGCDFEVVIENEMPVGFRRKKVYGWLQPTSESLRASDEVPRYLTVEFNRMLVDNLLIALKRVTVSGDVVTESRYFTRIIADAIDALDRIEAKRNPVKMKEAIANLKVQLFSKMMSRDLRR